MDDGQPCSIGDFEDSLGEMGFKRGTSVLVRKEREGLGLTVQPICEISSEIGMAFLWVGDWEVVPQASLLVLGQVLYLSEGQAESGKMLTEDILGFIFLNLMVLTHFHKIPTIQQLHVVREHRQAVAIFDTSRQCRVLPVEEDIPPHLFHRDTQTL
jgi:hypothetical protein